MPQDEQESPADPEPPAAKKRKPWFSPNRSGPGWHPSSWQGGVIIALIIAAVVVLVVLFRTGVL